MTTHCDSLAFSFPLKETFSNQQKRKLERILRHMSQSLHENKIFFEKKANPFIS